MVIFVYRKGVITMPKFNDFELDIQNYTEAEKEIEIMRVPLTRRDCDPTRIDSICFCP